MVCKSVYETFTVKNVSRLVAVFEVDITQVKDCCSISPIRGMIPIDGSREFTLTFNSDREC